jgi:hypothetical protein
LRSLAPDAAHVDSIHGSMASLFRALGVRRRWWPPGGNGKRPPDNGEIEYEVAPQIVPVRDEDDIRERGMEKKAARFYSETHQIFINAAYSAFTDFAGLLEAEYASLEDQEQVRRVALEISERTLRAHADPPHLPQAGLWTVEAGDLARRGGRPGGFDVQPYPGGGR